MSFIFKIYSVNNKEFIDISEGKYVGAWIVTIPFECDNFGNNRKLFPPHNYSEKFKDEELKNNCRRHFKIWLEKFPSQYIKFREKQAYNEQNKWEDWNHDVEYRDPFIR